MARDKANHASKQQTKKGETTTLSTYALVEALVALAQAINLAVLLGELTTKLHAVKRDDAKAALEQGTGRRQTQPNGQKKREQNKIKTK